MKTILTKWDNSLGIKLSKSILDELHLNEGDTLELSIINNSLIITNPKKRKTIKELFRNYEGNYKTEEIDWGDPKGKEYW